MAKVSSGQLFENAIAVQLNQLGELNCFRKSTGPEIDFILNREMVLEVKETPSAQDFSKMQSRAISIGIQSYVLIGRNPPLGANVDFVWGGNIA